MIAMSRSRNHTAGGRRGAVQRTLLAGCGALVVLSLGGCFGPRNYLNANDRLRSENLKLKRQVQDLQQKVALEKGQVSALTQRLHPKPAHMPGAVIPQLSKLEIGRFSGVTTDQGKRELRVYLQTLDQHGRLLPVAGRATVKAVAIPDHGQPEVVAHRTFEPKAFDQAYRSSFMGSHYSLVLPLGKPLPTDVNQLVVKVVFVQAETAVTLRVEKQLAVNGEAATEPSGG